MLDCAEATLISAIHRTESRGAHFRTDYPGAQRRGVAQAHRRHARRRRQAAHLLLPGDDHAVAAGGGKLEILRLRASWLTTRSESAATSPRSGQAPYWQDYDVDLEGHRSVLDGILQVRDREDGSIGIRCSCQAAICGSCGVRINGKASLACNTKLSRRDRARRRRRDRGRADGQHAGAQGPDREHGRGPLEEGPARRPVAAARRRPARARVRRAARVDDRHHAVDGVHPLRRLRLGLPVAGGGPAVHRAGRAREGVPLRRRSARRADRGAAQGPRRGPARHLRLHALLQLHRGLPEGRRADEPDHAPAAQGRARPRHQRPEQRRAATRRRFTKIIRKKGILDERKLLQDSFGPAAPAGRPRAAEGAADRAARLRARQDHAEDRALPREAARAWRTSSASTTTPRSTARS